MFCAKLRCSVANSTATRSYAAVIATVLSHSSSPCCWIKLVYDAYRWAYLSNFQEGWRPSVGKKGGSKVIGISMWTLMTKSGRASHELSTTLTIPQNFHYDEVSPPTKQYNNPDRKHLWLPYGCQRCTKFYSCPITDSVVEPPLGQLGGVLWCFYKWDRIQSSRWVEFMEEYASSLSDKNHLTFVKFQAQLIERWSDCSWSWDSVDTSILTTVPTWPSVLKHGSPQSPSNLLILQWNWKLRFLAWKYIIMTTYTYFIWRWTSRLEGLFQLSFKVQSQNPFVLRIQQWLVYMEDPQSIQIPSIFKGQSMFDSHRTRPTQPDISHKFIFEFYDFYHLQVISYYQNIVTPYTS